MFRKSTTGTESHNKMRKKDTISPRLKHNITTLYVAFKKTARASSAGNN